MGSFLFREHACKSKYQIPEKEWKTRDKDDSKA